MITDKKAEELEQRGLWRRAAARWQELLLSHGRLAAANRGVAEYELSE
ncbi:PerC family transcriptional regulator [Escherichia coli]|nr:PerC family transcriptional regulator [Escherichia coli]